MTTLTHDATVITPVLVEGYDATSRSGTIVQTLLDGDVQVSIRADAPRSGSLRLLFDDATTAWAAFALLSATVDTWTLADADVPAVGMDFVRAGDMRVRLDPETRQQWWLEVGFQEIV